MEELGHVAANDLREVNEALELEAVRPVLQPNELVAAEFGFEGERFLRQTCGEAEPPDTGADGDPRCFPLLHSLNRDVRWFRGHGSMPHLNHENVCTTCVTLWSWFETCGGAMTEIPGYRPLPPDRATRHKQWLVPLLTGLGCAIAVVAVVIYVNSHPALRGGERTAAGFAVLACIPLLIAATVLLLVVLPSHVRSVRGQYRRAAGRLTKGEASARDRRDRETSAHTTAWRRAGRLRAGLIDGTAPVVLPDGELALQAGEACYDVSYANYSRWYGTDDSYASHGFFAIGKSPFLLGAVVGSAIANRSNARRVALAAQAQWREHQFVNVVVTDRRFAIKRADGQWLSFWFNGISAFNFDLSQWLVDTQWQDTVPVRLVGPATATTVVAIVYALTGSDGLRANASLATLVR